jgi:tetratricopeptide (TPR) repeat protein
MTPDQPSPTAKEPTGDDLIAEAREKLRITYEQAETEEILEIRGDLGAELGLLYWKKEDFPEARKYFQLALGAYSKIHDDFHIASVQGALGSLEIEQQQYIKALQYLEPALHYWEQNPQIQERIVCLQNLAITSLRLERESLGVDYCIKAMELASHIPNEQLFAESAQILLEYYEQRQKFDIIRTIKQKALELWTKLDNKIRQFKTLIDIGVLSQMLEDFPAALGAFKRAYNVGFDLHDSQRMYLAEGFIGEVYFKQKEIEKAKEAYLRAFMLAVYLQNAEEIEKIRAVLLTLGMEQRDIQEKEKEAKKAIQK